MTIACLLGVHQWRVDHYSEIRSLRLVWIERVSCASCGLLRSKAEVQDDDRQAP